MGEKNLNGSVDLLAKAMRRVFVEAVEEGTKPLREDMRRMDADIKDGFANAAEERERLRGDMENGFAELRPPK